MANIENRNTFVWTGTSSAMCTDVSIGALDGKLQNTFIGSQNGASVPRSDPFSAGLGLSYQNLECGVGGLVYSSEVPYEIGNITESDYKEDKGHIGVNYPMQVVLSGGEGEGTYIITSQFKNNKPVYKNGEWWLWYDGISSWVISTPDLNKDGKFYLNNSNHVNDGPYLSDPVNVVVDENCIVVSGFIGEQIVSANGLYCEVATVNEKPAYKHATDDWYIFWCTEVDKLGGVAKWVLTDSPYNLMGKWINNGTGSKPNKFESPESSIEFENSTGIVEGVVADGSLATEGGVDVTALVVEDATASITTEEN